MSVLVELLDLLEGEGVNLRLQGSDLKVDFTKKTNVEAIVKKIKTHKQELVSALSPIRSNLIDESNFSLSPLQRAYWIGEQGIYDQSCVGYVCCTYHTEILDPARLEKAIVLCVNKLSSLRLQIKSDGTQFINDSAKTIYINHASDTQDVCHSSKAVGGLFEKEKATNIIVQHTSGHLGDCLSISCRLVVVDGQSFVDVVNTIARFYYGQLDPDELTAKPYTDYIKVIKARELSRAYRKSFRYWKALAASLPLSPKLPILSNRTARRSTDFSRLSYAIDSATWAELKSKVRQNGVGENPFLCYLYCLVLARWSENKSFCINMMVADRNTETRNVIGNCSTTILVPYYPNDEESLLKNIQTMQSSIMASLANAAVPGVEVLRLMTDHSTDSERSQILMPFVFNSSLHSGADQTETTSEKLPWQWHETYLQTPQVWLDFQAYEHNGTAYLHWDYVKARFPENIIEDIFSSFKNLLNRLTENSSNWMEGNLHVKLPLRQEEAHVKFNECTRERSESCIHRGFLENALSRPSDIAIQTTVASISYGQLLSEANVLARYINAKVGQGKHFISVCVQRGIEQVKSVLAVLLSGNAYIPISCHLPASRVQAILKSSRSSLIIVDKACAGVVEREFNIAYINIDGLNEIDVEGDACAGAEPSDCAYVIYTSGSTGEPKGVQITHRAAWNTLADMINRFGLTEQDRVLGLSSLSFDLSVYDIFATLSVGASLILTEEQVIPDPKHWLELIERHEPTVWNSVPALMELLLESHGQNDSRVLASFRLAMFSGDWISLGMIKKLLDASPKTTLVSLGGATEVSIWSCYHIIDKVLDGWSSIPYGRPLSRQSLHVLDEKLRPCPDLVAGDLYIGGDGLALCYLNSEEKTAASFIQTPEYGRLYKTGDQACFRDGLIEFLGRNDMQVKIRGFRIELGEIEAVALRFPGVETAVAIVTKSNNTSSTSVALIYLIENNTVEFDEEHLQRFFSDQLPSYMVPSISIRVDSLPLTSNGKIDRNSLTKLVADQCRAKEKVIRPKTDTEILLHKIWCNVLSLSDVCANVGFFSAGGNSILAIRLVMEIRKQLQVDVSPSQILGNDTIFKQAEFIDCALPRESVCIVQLSSSISSNLPPIIFIHPVGGDVQCYKAAADYLSDRNVYGISCPLISEADNNRHRSTSIEAMATFYGNEIVKTFRGKEVCIGGWSMGAVVAIEIEKQLKNQDVRLRPLLLIDPWVADKKNCFRFDDCNAVNSFLYDVFQLEFDVTEIFNGDTGPILWQKIRTLFPEFPPLLLPPDEIAKLFLVFKGNSQIIREYEITSIQPGALYIYADIESDRLRTGLMPLKEITRLEAGIDRRSFKADHWTIMNPENLSEVFKIWLDEMTHLNHELLGYSN